MDKKVCRRLAAFQAAQRRSGRYHVSPVSPHERAILEHRGRGHGDGLARIAGLLDPRNRI